ncbi:MAG: 4-amino-4-deoxychorismate lyase [Alphaproteobacteria bacterium]|nr:MAG: 4-amino-4-deoxychorismate lyase [Alphaproteobacteria bacterium]
MRGDKAQPSNAAINGRQPLSPAEALEPREAPPPPKRSRQARRGIVVVFNALISLLVFVAIVGSGLVYFGKMRFEEPGPLQASRTIVIREGSSLARIAEQLEANGIIDNELLFRFGVRAHRGAGSLKAGEYAFDPGMSMYDVMQTIRSGRGILYKVTFPEGLTVRQIFDRLAENEYLEGDLPAELPPEGSLLPDTYPFQRGTSRQAIIDQARRARDRVVAEIWDKRIDGLPIQTMGEFVTLASIVEKETGRSAERPRVAAVFINRLNQGMRLQSDPTVIYGLFGGEGLPPDRPIYRSDLDKPTPYNTYLNDGLPPGPIANPGRAALEAVANPSRTSDLYFVADGTGGHVFAVSYEEHQENVRRWREVERRLKEEAERQRAALAAKEAEQARENAAAAGETPPTALAPEETRPPAASAVEEAVGEGEETAD